MIEENQVLELERHKSILLATIDYEIAKQSKLLEPNRFEQFADFHQKIKQNIQKNYKVDGIEKIKKSLRSFTELFKQLGDLDYGNYIKDRTGYDIDIFENIDERINKILVRKSIRNTKEKRDVIAMIQLCRKSSIVQEKVPVLHNLMRDYDRENLKSFHRTNLDVNNLLEINSPDKKQYLTMYEINHSTTQISLDSASVSYSICCLQGVNLEVKLFWKHNQTIVIEASKNYLFSMQSKEVKTEGDLVKVEYIEI